MPGSAVEFSEGRFLQPDPAGMVDGPNMYAYCGNGPLQRTFTLFL